MFNYQLDADLANDEYQSTGGSGSNFVQLPFEAPVIYWKHGDSNVVPDKSGKYPLQYYGRWNCGTDDWDKATLASGIEVTTPLDDVEKRPSKKNGKVVPGEFYQVYAWRHLLFAVIAQRSRWFKTRDGKNLSHVQVLVQLAEKRDNVLVPTITAVLSAKVFASTRLEQLIKDWFKKIDELGPNIPPHYFYMAIGTFGSEQKFDGNHGTSTLPTLFIPDNLQADKLPFVGIEVARKMQEIKLNSQDWLNDQAWLKPEQQSSGKSAIAGDPEPGGYMEDDEQGIPF